jgi:hypothetical protein
MLREIIDGLARLNRQSVPFDPSTLGDAAAMETQWVPLVKGGASFRTHKLVVKNAQRIEFRTASGGFVFAAVFVLMGLGLAAVAIGQFIAGTFNAGKLFFIMPLAFGVVFAGVGVLVFRALTAPVVFDTSIGFFWKGRMKPEAMFVNASEETLRNIADLHSVYALQIVAEHCTGSKSSYYSYELNLVMKDGRRVNVIDHGDVQKVRADAGQLAALLGKPVWDATAEISNARTA